MTENGLYNQRVALGKTQSEVAEQAGISVRYYQYLEARKRKPTIHIAMRIATFLKTDVLNIFPDDLPPMLHHEPERQ